MFIVHSHPVEQECIPKGDILEVVESARSTTMARFHVGLQQDHVIIGLHRPEFGHPFGRLMIAHLGIIPTCRDKDIGIILRVTLS